LHCQLPACHPRRASITQHDGLHSLPPGDEPIGGLGPIAIAFHIQIAGSYMKYTSGIRAEGRVAVAHADSF
jgi:hypothetical protein